MNDDLMFEAYLTLIEIGYLPEPEYVELATGELIDLNDPTCYSGGARA